MSLVDVDSSNQAVDIFIGVKDSGIGIIQEHQKSIFDSFKQVPHSGKRQSITGTGLGLSISKKLVYMMGGDLSFTSEEGVGSNFYFQIPLKRIVLKAPTLSSVILETPQSIITAAAVAAEAAEAAAAATNTPVILPATTPAVVEAPLQFIGRVLVAEDNAINRKVIEKLIEKRGLAFTTVVDGVEAVKEYLKDPNAFQLVLMDCQMPNMDGFEATKAIREASSTRQSRIPIIAITANAIQGDEEKCLQAGMDAYITKRKYKS